MSKSHVQIYTKFILPVDVYPAATMKMFIIINKFHLMQFVKA